MTATVAFIMAVDLTCRRGDEGGSMACSWLIHIEVKGFTFGLYVITWALLGYVREIAVAYYLCIRIRILQIL